jgi:hypothetical protein
VLPLLVETAPPAPLVQVPAATVSLAPDVAPAEAPAEPQAEVPAETPAEVETQVREAESVPQPETAPHADRAPELCTEPQAAPVAAHTPEGPAENVTPIASAPARDTLAARVARLEDERPRRRGLATAALVACAAALGAFAGRVLAPAAPFGGPGAGEARVEAQEFVLRDAAGAVRGRLGMLADGAPYLHLLAPDGGGEIELSALRGPNVQLRLAGGDGSVLLATGPRGGPSLGLWQGGTPILLAPGNVARFPSSHTTQ